MNRRRMLEMSGLAAALGLAGCMGGGGDGGDGTTTPGTTEGNGTATGTGDGTQTTTGDLEHVDGQSFRFITWQNPNEFSWFYNDLDSNTFASTYSGNPSQPVGLVTYEYGLWGPWVHEAYRGGDINLREGVFESVNVSENEINFTLSDQFKWSNGDQVTSRDFIIPMMNSRISQGAPSVSEVIEQGAPNEQDAVTDFEINGEREGTFYSEGGHFGSYSDGSLVYEILIYRGAQYPTSIKPYSDYADALLDFWEEVKNGNANPWGDTDRRAALQNEVYGGQEGAEEWDNHFSQAENVVTHGAWQFDEILQNEIIFTPNEHHRYSDRINFDELVAEWMQEINTVWTSLNAGRLDYAQGNPQPHLMDEFPDTYEQFKHRNSSGTAVLLNHNWPGLHRPKGRQAFQHALDTPAICEQVSPNAWEAIQIPGGDVPHLDQYADYGLDQSWVEENLIDYSYDPETAAQKMEEAGFSKPNDTWLDENGDPIELVFHTQSGSPSLENIIVQQLSDFGVQAQVRPLEETQFENAKIPNNLCMWPESYGTGFPMSVARTYERGWLYETDAYATQWFNVSELNQLDYVDYIVQQQTPSEVEHMTTHAPPVGKPDGELQEYKTMWMTRQVESSQPEQLAEYMKKIFWLVNWHVPSWGIANTSTISWLNTENWIWPQDADHWQYAENGSLEYMDLHAWGDQIFANPDSPKPQ